MAKKGKNKFRKTVNRLLIGLLVLMGFTGCQPDEEEEDPIFVPMYGATFTSYKIKEKAVTTETKEIRPEIKVDLEENPNQ